MHCASGPPDNGGLSSIAIDCPRGFGTPTGVLANQGKTKVFVTLRQGKKKAMKYPFPVPSPNPNCNTKS